MDSRKLFVIPAAFLCAIFIMSACRPEAVVPVITSTRFFLSMNVTPSSLAIRAPGQPRESSRIIAQLTNQGGQTVAGQVLRFLITNEQGNAVNVGKLSQTQQTTDSTGFAQVTYTAPNTKEQASSARIFIVVIHASPSTSSQLTQRSSIDLEVTLAPLQCSIAASSQAPQIGTTVNFTATVSDATRVDSFGWDFGDGNSTSTDTKRVSHTYLAKGTFTVLLSITDKENNVSTCQTRVSVQTSSPTCQFTFNPETPKVNQTVTFDASGSVDTAEIKSYSWDFGDGSDPASGQIVTHTFTQVDSFRVRLSVTDDEGNVSVCDDRIFISSGKGPSCSFTNNPNPSCAGQNVNFNGSGSDPDGGPVTFAWDFGDGTSSTEENPSKTFTSAGTRNVKLTVTDDEGEICTFDADQFVSDVPSISSFTPAAQVGGGVTINGSIFISQGSGGSLDFNGSSASYSVNSSGTQMGTSVPSGATDGPIHVSNNCGSATSAAFDVIESLVISDVSLNEGSSGTTTFSFTVTVLSGGSIVSSNEAITFDFRVDDGSATAADNDYVDDSGSRTIPSGSSNITIDVAVNGDVTSESPEDFFVVLTNPSGAVLADDTGVGTIQNDD